MAERTDALTDATRAAGANDSVETERHVPGGLDLVAALERDEGSPGSHTGSTSPCVRPTTVTTGCGCFSSVDSNSTV